MDILRLVLVLLLATPAFSVFAGVLVTSEDGTVSSFSAGMVKTVSPEDGTVVLFDLNAETLTLVNRQEKTFSRATVTEYCRVAEALREEALAQIPPEQRRMMEQLLGAGKKGQAPVVAVKNLGSGDRIAGYPTERFLVTANGEKYEELHLSSEMPVFKEIDTDKLWALGEEFSACMTSGFGLEGTPTPEEDPAYRELMRRGYPMKTVDWEEGSPEVWDLVIAVEEQSIAPAEFRPPADYREIDLRSFFEQQEGEGTN